MKKSLLLALLLLPLLATAALAAPTESAFLASLAAPGACALDLQTTAALAGQLAPEAKVNTHGCLAGFCRTSADCPCSTGAGTCTGGTCHYSTGGMGGGGGGLACPGAFCTTDAQCLANCPSGPSSFCNMAVSPHTCTYLP